MKRLLHQVSVLESPIVVLVSVINGVTLGVEQERSGLLHQCVERRQHHHLIPLLHHPLVLQVTLDAGQIQVTASSRAQTMAELTQLNNVLRKQKVLDTNMQLYKMEMNATQVMTVITGNALVKLVVIALLQAVVGRRMSIQLVGAPAGLLLQHQQVAQEPIWDAGRIQATVCSRVQTTAELLHLHSAQTKPDKRDICTPLYRMEMNAILVTRVITGSVLENKVTVLQQAAAG
jgi:hypothetical protein